MKGRIVGMVRTVGLVLMFWLVVHSMGIAQDGVKYGISIGGVELTSMNQSELNNPAVFPAIKRGVVFYQPSAKQLTLTDAEIEGTLEIHAVDGMASLFLEGNSRIITRGEESTAAMQVSGHLQIVEDGSSDATLSLWGKHIGLKIGEKSMVEIPAGVTMYAYGALRGVEGAEPVSSVLKLKHRDAKVYALGDEQGSVLGVNLQMEEGIHVSHPVGAVYENARVLVSPGGEVLKKPAAISKDEPAEVGFAIQGRPVKEVETFFLCGTGFNELSRRLPIGAVEYNKKVVRFGRVVEHQLTLRNVSITDYNHTPLHIDGKITQISIEGQCRLEGKPGLSVSVNHVLGIEGPGTLNCINAQESPGAAFLASGATVMLDGRLHMEVSSKSNYGIRGEGNAELSLKRAYLHASGADEAVSGMRNIDLDAAMGIISPEGATIEDGRIVKGAEVVKDVKFAYRSPFSVGGVDVTEANYSDLEKKGGDFARVIKSGKGTVIYNWEKKELSLLDAEIDSPALGESPALQIYEPITIRQTGNNRLSGHSGVQVGASVSVIGEGSLVVIGFWGQGLDFLESDPGSQFTLRGGRMLVKGDREAVHGHGGHVLRVEHGDLALISPVALQQGVRVDLGGGLVVAHPQGGQLDPDGTVRDAQGQALTAGAILLGKPTESYGLKIGGVEVNSGTFPYLDQQAFFPAYVGGSIAYNPQKKILHLEGTTLKSSGEPVLENMGIAGLTIRMDGDKPISMESDGSSGWILRENTTVELPKSNPLISSRLGTGIVLADGKSLTVGGESEDGTYLNVRAVQGVGGLNGHSLGTLTLSGRAGMHIESTHKCVEVSSIRLGHGRDVIYPVGAQVDGGELKLPDGSAVEGYAILGSEYTQLGVQISSEHLTKGILQEMLSLSNGAIDFDPSTNTLHLDRVPADWKISVKSVLPHLSISLKAGLSILSNANSHSPLEGRAISIKGEGALMLMHNRYAGVRVSESLTISDKAKVFVAGPVGIGSFDIPSGLASIRLIVKDDAMLSAQTAGDVQQDAASIANVSELQLADGVAVQVPSNYQHDSKIHSGAICDADGNPVKGMIRIGREPEASLNFSLGGVEVTSYSYPYLRQELDLVGATSARVEFDPSTGELLLHNLIPKKNRRGTALAVRTGSALKRVRISDRVVFMPDDETKPAVDLNASLTIAGGGYMLARSRQGVGVSLGENVKLTVDGQVQLEVHAAKGALRGPSAGGAQLEVVSCTSVILNKPESGFETVKHMQTLSLGEGFQIRKPVGAKFDAASGSVILSDGNPCHDEVIVGREEESYGFSMGGIEVNSWNWQQAFQSFLQGGTLTFDPASGTLKLENATLTAWMGAEPFLSVGANSRLSRIEVGGENHMKFPSSTAMRFMRSIELVGRGSLGIDAGVSGIELGKDVELALDGGIRLGLVGQKYGIVTLTSVTDGWGKLKIRHAAIKVQGTEEGALLRIQPIDLEEGVHEYRQPAGAMYDEAQKGVCTPDGMLVKGHVEVEIAPVSYGLVLGAMEVNRYNKDLLMNRDYFPSYEKGEISFDESTMTLKLRDAQLRELNTYCLQVTKPLKLIVEGDNSMYNVKETGMFIDKGARLEVSGSGELSLHGYRDAMLKLASGSALKLLGSVTLAVTSTPSIVALSTVTEDPAVEVTEQSRLILNSFNTPMLGAQLQLGDGVRISEPTGATFDEISKRFVVNGEPVLGVRVVVGEPILPPNAAVQIEPEELTLYYNSEAKRTATLSATVQPSTLVQTVHWSSDNEGVAKVDPVTGKVTALATGTANITATSTLTSRLKRSCVITVKEYKPVVRVVLSQVEVNLEAGQSVDLIATVEPGDATDPSITWESSNQSVATVDNKGRVVGIGNGSAEIKAKSVDGVEVTCTVKVTAKAIESIMLSKSELELLVGEKSEKLSVVFTPGEGVDTRVSWSSSAESVATVEDGVVTAIAPGKATITVTSVSDNTKSAVCQVVVKEPVKLLGISLSSKSVILGLGQSLTLSVTFTPEDAADKRITWESSDPAVATVENGVVKGLSKGSATIRVKSVVGDLEDACDVLVDETVHVTGISLSKNSLSLRVGESETLEVSITPADASNKAVEWSSSDASVATVANGKVVALAVGNVQIKVKSQDNGLEAVCDVKVSQEEKSAVESMLLAKVFAAPNPFDAHFEVRNTSHVRSYTLFDLAGQTLRHGRTAGSESLRFDLSDFASGVYLLQLQAADGMRVLRVVKR